MALLALVTTSWAQTNFTMKTAELVDKDAKPTIPVLGDNFYYLKATWDASGLSGKQSYKVKFTMADRSAEFPFTTGNGQGLWAYAGLWCPMAGPIPYKVSILLDGKQVGTPLTGSFTPKEPMQPIDYYDTKTLDAWQKIRVSWKPNSGMIDSLSFWLSKPITDTFQKVLDVPGPAEAKLTASEPSGYPLFVSSYLKPDLTQRSMEQRFRVEVSNCRVNEALLQKTTWSDYDKLPSEARAYLNSEQSVQRDSREIRKFVASHLPKSYRTHLSPYETAKMLFQGVVKDLSYKTPCADNAVDVLKQGKGDCGGMSSVLIASLRHIGIPARLTAGWWADTPPPGASSWHAWTEFWIPGAGWVSADPAVSDGVSPTGEFPYFFGFIPDFNKRVAVGRGDWFKVGNYGCGLVQAGDFWYEGTAVVDKVDLTATAKPIKP